MTWGNLDAPPTAARRGHRGGRPAPASARGLWRSPGELGPDAQRGTRLSFGATESVFRRFQFLKPRVDRRDDLLRERTEVQIERHQHHDVMQRSRIGLVAFHERLPELPPCLRQPADDLVPRPSDDEFRRLSPSCMTCGRPERSQHAWTGAPTGPRTPRIVNPLQQDAPVIEQDCAQRPQSIGKIQRGGAWSLRIRRRDVMVVMQPAPPPRAVVSTACWAKHTAIPPCKRGSPVPG